MHLLYYLLVYRVRCLYGYVGTICTGVKKKRRVKRFFSSRSRGDFGVDGPPVSRRAEAVAVGPCQRVGSS